MSGFDARIDDDMQQRNINIKCKKYMKCNFEIKLNN